LFFFGDDEMPVRQLAPKKPPAKASQLVSRLVSEWAHPDSSAAQPIILEEREGVNRPVHVYVVWDDWADLTAVERSEVVMEAFIQRYGQEESLNVTVAMGLTPSEADNLQIPYKD
jgi:hypothetical protein